MLTAKQARDIAQMNGRHGNRIESIMYAIITAAKEGEAECFIPMQGDRLKEEELSYIRGLGYKIEWFSARSWYVVSWQPDPGQGQSASSMSG